MEEMKPIKSIKAPMNVHTPKSQHGTGDYYGTAIKNKVGRMRDDSMGMTPVQKNKLGNPPKRIA